jgi:hypothetical protein
MSVKSVVNFDLKKNSYTSGIVTETMPGKYGVNFNLKKNSFTSGIVTETMPGKNKGAFGKKIFLN